MGKECNGDYSHVLKYTGVFGSVQGLNILSALARNKVAAIFLGPEGMGLASLFQTAVNLISQTTNLGISFSAVKHVSELFDSDNEERLAHFIKIVRAWSLLTGLIGMLVCIAGYPVLNQIIFTGGNHLLHFMLLSPLLFLLALTGGEIAILKGTRLLKQLAYIQLLNVMASLLIAVPIYYFMGLRGIVPVMVLMGIVSMCLTIYYSYKLYPLHLKGAMGILGEGMSMVRLGISFTLAGILGSCAEFAIRIFLNSFEGLETVGLYNTGFTMTMLYAGVVFSAMEVDFFPRLSAVSRQVKAYNDLINKQAEVSLLLIGAIIPLAILLLPFIIPLLTSNEFLPVVNVMRLMALSLYLRSINLSLEYLSLAKGDSKSYLFLEAIYDIALVVLVVSGYHYGKLLGTGYALLFLSIFNFLIVSTYMYVKYKVKLQMSVLKYLLVHFLLGIITFLITQVMDGIAYWIIGSILSLLGVFFSFTVLNMKNKE